HTRCLSDWSSDVCSSDLMCHNEKLSSGGLNISPFLDRASITANREGWERIVTKLHTGEMPPKGMPRPPADKLDALMKYVQDQFRSEERRVGKECDYWMSM